MRQEELNRFWLFSFVLGVLGVAGAAASIITGYGAKGVIVSFILVVLLAGTGYWMLRPVLVKNPMGVTILQAINSVGLVDIENRNDNLHVLPPSKIFEIAKREIIVSGVTGYMTLNEGSQLFHQILDEGQRIYVLILDPDHPVSALHPDNDHVNVPKEIMLTIDIIKNARLNKHPGFNIKFMQILPTFTGIMIDGDIRARGTPLDEGGQIRVQPARVYGSQHKGIILQFSKKSGSLRGTFDFFAADMREQWEKAVEKPNLLQ